jgi:undecaprenyl-diphosphatase
MPLYQAILLGLVQGLTEFLPVSSTAHLLVSGELLGQDLADERFRAFTTIIQLGTTLAVVVFFAQDLRRFVGAGLASIAHRSPLETPDSRLAWLIVIGTIPAAAIGKLLERHIEALGNWVIAGALVGLGLILLAAELFAAHRRAIGDLGPWDALLIGLAQAVALVPGSSRSGTTITAGLLLGLKREDAARFSFLLSVPIIVGAGLYKAQKALPIMRDEPAWRNATIVGTIVSAAVGYLVVGWLLRYLRTRTTLVFVAWRVVMGVAIAILIARGALPEGSAERPPAPAPAREAR